jgi:hypothetical protein
MELEQAKIIATKVVDRLTPCCERIAIGSIRRQKSWVNDIDIVCIPGNQGKLLYVLHDMGTMIVGGPKIMRYKLKEGIELDLYIANPETWATLLLIRTGSKETNIRLCSLARKKGMMLHADGSGLEKCLAGEGTEVDDVTTSKIPCDTETSILCGTGEKELAMALLNYTTTIDSTKTAQEIESILQKHGATAVVKEFSGGSVTSLFFKVATPTGTLGIRLPIDPDAVLRVLGKQYQTGKVPLRLTHDRPQAERIAWRILKDWVEAQMALLETEMVKLEQIFLPYVMVNGKQTLFQAFTEGKLITQGKPKDSDF